MVVNHYWPEHAPGNFYGNPYKVLRCKGKNEIKMQITRILRDDQNMFIWEKASFWQVCFRFFFDIFFSKQNDSLQYQNQTVPCSICFEFV